MSRKTLKIGLFGLGCVGNGLVEVLENTPSLNAQIVKVCVKDPRKLRKIPSHFITYDPDDLLSDPEINTIVELIDDADAAYNIVMSALRNGKSVVSANKKMIAEHFEELIQSQSETGSALLYEAACCASIPIIRNLEEYYDNDLLQHIEGVVNGSTNYILTQVNAHGVSPEDALLQAQEQGYAESNPIMDVGGYDAKFKLILLMGHAFGTLVKPEDVFHVGIDRLGEFEFKYAGEKKQKIKLVALAQRNETGEITALVMPKFVDQADALYGVDDVFNGVKTQTHFSDTQFFSGKGAGAYPTASAVLSDISALSYDYKYEYKKLNYLNVASIKRDFEMIIFIKYSIAFESLILNHFHTISERYQAGNVGYLIGDISMNSLRDLLAMANCDASPILIELKD